MSRLRKERALAQIRDLVTSGQYPPGKLFSENELASRLNMSRSPVRDGLAVLEREGLVERIPQVGVRVRLFSDDDLREVFLMRELLEPRAAELCGRWASSCDRVAPVLQELTEAMHFHAARGEVSSFLAADVEFHWQTAALAGHPLIADVLRQVGNRIRIIGFTSTPDKSSMLTVVEEHRAILAEISRGASSQAGEEALRHINLTRERINKGRGHPIF